MTGQQRRQSIIEAAIAVIARTRFERCTVAVIAGEVGVAEPVIYRHFINKRAAAGRARQHLRDVYRLGPLY